MPRNPSCLCGTCVKCTRRVYAYAKNHGTPEEIEVAKVAFRIASRKENDPNYAEKQARFKERYWNEPGVRERYLRSGMTERQIEERREASKKYDSKEENREAKRRRNRKENLSPEEWNRRRLRHNETERVLYRKELETRRAEARNKRRLRKAGFTKEGVDYAEDVLRRDPCSYCGQYYENQMQADHIIAVRSGGQGGWENLTSACLVCNLQKNDTPLLHFLVKRMSSRG